MRDIPRQYDGVFAAAAARAVGVGLVAGIGVSDRFRQAAIARNPDISRMSAGDTAENDKTRSAIES